MNSCSPFFKDDHTKNEKDLPFIYKKIKKCHCLQFFSGSNELSCPLIYSTEMIISESVTLLQI